MKLLLILSLLGSTAFAVPVVVVKSPSSVTVDGQDFGAVADCMANNPHLSAAIQTALAAWSTSQTQKSTADIAAAESAAAADLAQRLADKDAEKAAVIAERDAAVATSALAAAELADTRALAVKVIRDASIALAAGNLEGVQSAIAEASTPAKERAEKKELEEIEKIEAAAAADLAEAVARRAKLEK